MQQAFDLHYVILMYIIEHMQLLIPLILKYLLQEMCFQYQKSI